jgi:virginiamycin B lyase
MRRLTRVLAALVTLAGATQMLLSGSASSADTIVTITEGPALGAGARAQDIVQGADGNLWVAETSGRVARVTPGGAVTEFSAGISAVGSPPDDLGPYSIAAGPDGNLWFTEPSANRVARITPSGVVTEFSAGITPGATPIEIASGPDGNLWFTETNGDRVARITPSGTVTEFGAGGITPGAHPWGIAVGPDGNLWVTEIGKDGIARISTSGGVTEFFAGITSGAGPGAIASGPDGNLWFSEYSGDRIGRITPTGSIAEFSAGIPAGASPGGITTGSDGNLWFTEPFRDRVARITPEGAVSEFSDGLSHGSIPVSMTTTADGSMWIAESSGNRLARVTSAPAPPPPPPPPPPQAPHLSITSARFSGTFSRSHLGTKSSVLLAGGIDRRASVTATLVGPQRPAGRRLEVALGTRQAGPGAFSLTLPIGRSLTSKLLPGTYQIRLATPGAQSTGTAALKSPREGVVMSHRISTSRHGPNLLAVTKTTRLWATFRFAPGGAAHRRLRARWYAPHHRAPVAAFAVRGPTAFSYWQAHHRLAAGRWRCVLVAGSRTVDVVSIRVG